MPASPVHHTATTDATWDGPAAMAATDDQKTLAYMCAWHAAGDDADGDGLPDHKGSYKDPHHAPRVGSPANMAGCRAIMSRLASTDVPAADKAGIAAHARAHMADGSK